MNRVKIVLVIVVSLFAGGLIMRQSSSLAQPTDPWGNTIPPPPVAGPLPPVPPKAPKPPKAPRAPRAPRGGISISMNGNKIQITGLEQLVATHLAAARQMLDQNPNIPKDIRDKIVARMDKVKAIVDKNLANLSGTDLDKLGDQLDKMGDELEKAMEGLDADLAKLGDKTGKKMAKDIAKDLGKLKNLQNFQFHWGNDGNDSNDSNDSNDGNDSSDSSDSSDEPDSADSSDEPADVQVVVGDLKNFALKPAQRDAIQKAQAQANQAVAVAKIQLDSASKQLELALANIKISDGEIERAVDQVTAAEGSIRKARLLAWLAARRQLDADQVKQLEAAVKKTR